MAGEAQGAVDAQELWDEVAREREAGEESPSELQTTEEPAPEQTEEEQQAGEQPAAGEQKTEQPAGEKQEEDPFAGLNPAVRARLEKLDQLEAQLPTLINSVKTAEGRVAAMQREMDVAKQAAKAAQSAPSQAQIAAASGDVKKWESLKTDFPEWADATEQFVNAKLAGLTPQQAQGLDAAQVEELVRQQGAKARAEALAAIEEAKVEIKHPDWVRKINSEDFKKWFGEQPDDVKKLSKSPRGLDAIRLIDLFDERETAAPSSPAPSEVQQARNKKLAAAVNKTPQAKAAPATGKTVDEMSPAELWEYERKRAAKRSAERGLSY